MLVLSTELKANLQDFLFQTINSSSLDLKLNIIPINPSLASQKYIQIKAKVAQNLGIQTCVWEFGKDLLPMQIEQIIASCQQQKEGLIFQLPVPEQFNSLVKKTPKFCDVDLLGLSYLELMDLGFLPPTIAAIDLVIKSITFNSQDIHKLSTTPLDLKSKVVVVIGQGNLVGKPLLDYLKTTGATIISINKSTLEAKKLVQMGDIVVCAAGQKGLLDSTWFKAGAIVVDAATSESDGELVGDVAKDVDHSQIYLSPSPGGIGRLTVLCLFWNLIKLKQLSSN